MDYFNVENLRRLAKISPQDNDVDIKEKSLTSWDKGVIGRLLQGTIGIQGGEEEEIAKTCWK